MRYIAFFILITAFSHVNSQEITVTTFHGDDPITDISINIMTEAYKQIGMSLIVEPHPAERSLMTANAGLMDGELFRIEGIDKDYPNLIRVPVAVAKIEIVAFVKTNKKFSLDGWRSLIPYKVSYNRGVKIVENNLIQPTIAMSANSVEHAMIMLNANRADVAIDARLNCLKIIGRLGMQNIVALEPPLEIIYGYHYLHQKHKELVKPLLKVLQKMEATGVIKKYQDMGVKSL